MDGVQADELFTGRLHLAATVVCRKFGAVHEAVAERSASADVSEPTFVNDSSELVSMARLRMVATPLAIVWSEFAQNAIVDHFAGHFAGGES